MVFEPYKHERTLRHGHVDGVNSVSFSPSGRYLASGGEDRMLIIWDPVKGNLLRKLHVEAPITCISWRDDYALFCGCIDGKLLLYQQFLGAKSFKRREVLIGVDHAISSLDYNVASDRLAIGVGSEVQLAERLNSTYATSDIMPCPQNVKGGDHKPVRPTSLQLIANGTQLVVAYLNHGIFCWDIQTRTSLWQMGPEDPFPPISASVTANTKMLLAFNLQNGLHLYYLGADAPHQSYQFTDLDSLSGSYPCHGLFLNGERQVTCGSLTGRLHVWDTETGAVCQTLEHDKQTVQAICSVRRGNLIRLAAGTSRTTEDTFIRIWSSKSSSITAYDYINASLLEILHQLTSSGILKFVIAMSGLLGVAFVVVGILPFLVSSIQDLKPGLTSHIASGAERVQKLVEFIISLWRSALGAFRNFFKGIARSIFLSLLDE